MYGFSTNVLFIVLCLITLILSLPFRVFSHPHELMVFLWSLSDSKFSEVSRTLLSILSVLKSTVVLDGVYSSTNFQVFQTL